MPDLSILAYPAIVLAAAVLGVALTRNHYANRNTELQNGYTVVQADRDRLLEALAHLVVAVNDPAYNLTRSVREAEKAVDGRWTQ